MAILTFATEGSTRIAGMSYDTIKEELKVDFIRGGSYIYHEVSEELYNAMKTAKSVGKTFESLIKRGGFKYTKV